jgi:glycine C-acetyltransferase
MTMVDDAHGEGVLGDHGRGIVDHYGLVGKIDIEIGTLSKAFGVVGGYVAGSKVLVEYLKQRGRPFLFSTGPTPADVAACIAAVGLLEESDERVRRLWENARYFKEKMKSAGFDTGKSETPITPVMIGDAAKSSDLSKQLFQEGVYAQSIGYPTVARGKARIRVMISAVHSRADLDFGVEQFVKCGRRLGLV